MRQISAAFLDAGAAALMGYIGFRVAFWGAPCGAEIADCFPLTPLVVACVAFLVAVYFAVGFLLWNSTPAQRLLRRESIHDGDDHSW
ncbi:MAG: hypothetical protein NVSMB52_17850 [Chloroflexota bacterium]